MSDLQLTRMREHEPAEFNTYERSMKYMLDLRDRASSHVIVLKGEDLPWEQSRQGRLKFYMCRETDHTKSVLRDWDVFIHDIKTHSGKHRHQGGLVIYVIEGEGYTEVDDVTLEWEAGDLLLLPIKEGGVEHKHYNKHPGQGCKWMAFIYKPYTDEIGYYMEQREVSPDYR